VRIAEKHCAAAVPPNAHAKPLTTASSVETAVAVSATMATGWNFRPGGRLPVRRNLGFNVPDGNEIAQPSASAAASGRWVDCDSLAPRLSQYQLGNL
jgi:hypothetical protein